MSLDETPTDGVVTVVRVAGSEGFRRRLLELGFVPGTRVVRVGRGEPLRFRVRDAVLALRRIDARNVVVEAA